MLKFHPLADLFPMMSDEEINALGEDMLENSQHEPIALFEGMILDGRNRYRACLLKGIEPRFREQRPADPAAFVASANLHRRHLEVGQRAIIAARLATMKRGDNQHSSAGETSQGEAAELLNVAKRSVERAAEVIKHGVPDLVDAVERGDVKVTPAAAFAEQNPPIEQQRKIIEAGSAVAAVEAASMLKRPESDIDAADRAASRRPQPKPDVSAAADHAEAQARRVSERRTITEGVMKTLDPLSATTSIRRKGPPRSSSSSTSASLRATAPGSFRSRVSGAPSRR
jgi:hypothetical protein